MSSRQLRKLQKQRELEKDKVQGQGEGSIEVEHNSLPKPRPRANIFAALGGDENDAQDDEEDQRQDTEGVRQDVEEVPAPLNTKKSKKGKKKKRAKAAKAANATSEIIRPGQQSDEDEIDKAMKELNIQPQHRDMSTAAQANSITPQSNNLFQINPYDLKAIHEMRKLFGRDVIESANAEEEQENSRRGRRPMQEHVDLETFLREPPGAKQLPKISLRRNIFVQGREHWPLRTAGGLTMKEVGKAADASWTEYAYFHDTEYDGVQAFFFACVQTGDPMRMVHLVKQVPYHVSTLLQVSSVAKQDQNMALAAELCERALFTFGRVATSSFRQNIEQGRARLDFRRPENRQFWLAGYHYLKSLVRKGTYRTALEWAKLLYSLDAQDPYAMRHYIHFLAIRAYEANWLLGFLDQLDKLGDNSDTVYLQQSRVLARLQLGDMAQARQDLTSGMQQVPWLYCALFQELNLDAPPSIWGIHADSDARLFRNELYLYQAKELWNNAQAIALLQDVARSISQVKMATLPADEAPVDLGVTRLAYLEGQTSLLALAPRDILDSQPNYEFDPLPPSEGDNIFTGDGSQLPWRDRQQQQQSPGHLDDILARLLAQRGGRLAVVGQAGDAEADLDGLDTDEEELRQDIAAQVAASNEPGMLQGFLHMLGIRGDIGESSRGDAGDGFPEEREGLPGAWPAEDDDSEGG